MNKFKEIFLDLEQKILTKVYPPHTLLPSEKQLIDIYGASRETIRKIFSMKQPLSPYKKFLCHQKSTRLLSGL